LPQAADAKRHYTSESCSGIEIKFLISTAIGRKRIRRTAMVAKAILHIEQVDPAMRILDRRPQQTTLAPIQDVVPQKLTKPPNSVVATGGSGPHRIGHPVTRETWTK